MTLSMKGRIIIAALFALALIALAAVVILAPTDPSTPSTPTPTPQVVNTTYEVMV